MAEKRRVKLDADPEIMKPAGSDGLPRPKKELDVKPTAATKPGLDWDGAEVEVTSDLYAEPISDWNELLTELGYDPAVYEVIEPVKISCWDSTVGDEVRRMWSYKANIQVRKTIQYRDDDYRELVSLVKKHRKKAPKPVGDGAFIVNLADWQAGKADGPGVEGFTKFMLDTIDRLYERVRELKSLGRAMDHLVIAGVGDMIENCNQNYSSQTFTVELNRRQQIRLVRRLLFKLVTKLAGEFSRVTVLAVPGNHGENRTGGKAYTTVGDNDDVAVFEMLADILSANPDVYGHVEFVIPEDEIYVILEVIPGEYIGWTHGHVTVNGADPQKKIREWWKDQTFTGKDIGFVRILNTGHYHHLSIIEYDDNKIHIQCPSADGGSEWFENLKGVDSRPGTVTYIVDSSRAPYRDLEVI